MAAICVLRLIRAQLGPSRPLRVHIHSPPHSLLFHRIVFQ